MVSIFAKACICWGNKIIIFNFFERPSCYANGSLSASSKISFHGLPSTSKRPSIRKHSVAVIITVNSISFYKTAICREIFSKYFFASIFVNFQKIQQRIKIRSQKFQKLDKNTTVAKSYVSKVAGFYGSNHRMRSLKKVFLERCLQSSQEKACVRDSILIKLHS